MSSVKVPSIHEQSSNVTHVQAEASHVILCHGERKAKTKLQMCQHCSEMHWGEFTGLREDSARILFESSLNFVAGSPPLCRLIHCQCNALASIYVISLSLFACKIGSRAWHLKNDAQRTSLHAFFCIGSARTGFMDDAVRIERLLTEQTPNWMESRISTLGAIALHVNSNEHTDAEDSRAWIYFDARWWGERTEFFHANSYVCVLREKRTWTAMSTQMRRIAGRGSTLMHDGEVNGLSFFMSVYMCVLREKRD